MQRVHVLLYGSHGQGDVDVSYNPADPPEAYSNPSIHIPITEYMEIGRALHGDTWDPATQPLSGEAIMRAGGGKKHDRYWLANSLVDTASTPTLSQFRARTTDSTPPIRPRFSGQRACNPGYFCSICRSLLLVIFCWHCNIWVQSYRPGWTKRRRGGRRSRRGWRRSRC